MENTIKNKILFFIKYWGQKFYYKNEFGTYPGEVGDFHFNKNVEEKATIFLKSIEQPTNEDAKALALHLGATPLVTDDVLIVLGKEEFLFLQNKSATLEMEIDQIHKAFNFIESLGYYTGDGTEIRFGWCKIKNN